MITKRMNVYYCEHCGKRYLAKWAINRHEPGCTANPHRLCGLCGNNMPVQTGPFAQFLEPAPHGIESEWLPSPKHFTRQIIPGKYDAFIAEVHDSVEGCPVCMLAVIRQLHLTRIEWEYKAAKDAYWASRNEESRQAEYHELYTEMMRTEGCNA